VLDLEQADFSAAHLREVLQQRHDLLLKNEVILVALGPGTALSAQPHFVEISGVKRKNRWFSHLMVNDFNKLQLWRRL
jgi:hypothetical protein